MPWRTWSGFLILGGVALALGAGLALVAFVLVGTLWTAPEGITDADRLVVLLNRDRPAGPALFSDAALARFESMPQFEAVAGQVVLRGTSTDGLIPRVRFGGDSRPLEVQAVTPNFFSVVGVTISGRDLGADTGGHVGVIISDDLWHRAFGGRRDVIGRQVPAFPKPVYIRGVAPPGFRGVFRGENTDLWVDQADLPVLAGIAALKAASLPKVDICRLRRGASLADVRQMLSQSDRPAERAYDILPVRRVYGPPNARTALLTPDLTLRILAVTSGSLLLGCGVLLATLLTLHFGAREREFAIREALGASPVAMLRQISLELGLLAALLSTLAWLVAAALLELLPKLTLPNGVDLSRLQLSLRVGDVALVAGTVFVVVTVAVSRPALALVRRRGRGVSRRIAEAGAPSRGWALRTTIAVATSVTVSFLVVARMFTAASESAFASAADLELERSVFLTVQTRPLLNLAASQGDLDVQADATMQSFASFVSDVSALGVDVALGEPFWGFRAGMALSQPRTVQTQLESLSFNFAEWLVDGNYLEAMGARAVVGTTRGGAGHAVVTRSFAERVWPDSPVGERLRTAAFEAVVVGVVDVGFGGVEFGRPPVVFFLGRDTNQRSIVRSSGRLDMVLRLEGQPNLRALEVAANRSFPDAREIQLVPAESLVRQDMARERLGAWFLRAFGWAIAALSCVGVFAVVASHIRSRRREFAVMIALGAPIGFARRRAIYIGLVSIAAGVAGSFLTSALAISVARLFVDGSGQVDFFAPAVFGLALLGFSGLAGWCATSPLRSLQLAAILRAD